VSMTVEALATAISQIDDIDPEFAAMIATGLLPFIERHIAAGLQGAGCGACGDGCKDRGSCRLADESPKPAGAVPLPEADGCLIADGEQLVFSKTRPVGVLARDVYGRTKLHRYGDAREAAGRADAVPALDSVLRERGLPTVADALGYSRNFAAANPALSQTTRDHIEGLCNMLEIAANHPAPAPQPMTTQGEAVAEVYERFSCKRDQLGDSYRESEGPALRFTGEPLPVGTKLYTGSQP